MTAPRASFSLPEPRECERPRARSHQLSLLRDVQRRDDNCWIVQELTTRLRGRVEAAETTFASATDLASALHRAAVAHQDRWFRPSARRTYRAPLRGGRMHSASPERANAQSSSKVDVGTKSIVPMAWIAYSYEADLLPARSRRSPELP